MTCDQEITGPEKGGIKTPRFRGKDDQHAIPLHSRAHITYQHLLHRHLQRRQCNPRPLHLLPRLRWWAHRSCRPSSYPSTPALPPRISHRSTSRSTRRRRNNSWRSSRTSSTHSPSAASRQRGRRWTRKRTNDSGSWRKDDRTGGNGSNKYFRRHGPRRRTHIRGRPTA